MPADSIPAAHSASNGDVGTSRLEGSFKKDYTIPTPSKRPHIGRGGTNNSVKTSDPMSELGQNQKSGDAIATSGLPLKADIKRTSRHVRKVPIGDIMARRRHAPQNGHQSTMSTQLRAAQRKSVTACKSKPSILRVRVRPPGD